MTYKVISEFVDRDGRFYGVDFPYPLEGAETPTEERVELLLGGEGKHSYIAEEAEEQEENHVSDEDETEGPTAEELEKLNKKELQAMLSKDEYDANTNKNDLIAAILENQKG